MNTANTNLRLNRSSSPAARLAIVLQVCPFDVWIAQRLVRLIASFEKERSDIEFILSARRDTNFAAIEQIVGVAKNVFKNVQVIRGKRFGTGWPNGCNDLWQETMMRVSQLAEAGKITATGVLTFESDCIPLRPDWLDFLADEWKKNGFEAGKICVGHAHYPADKVTGRLPDNPTHINGNAMFDVRASDLYPELNSCDARYGWDAYHAKVLLEHGSDTNAIFQRYRIKQIIREEVEAIRKNDVIPALFHGIKGTNGLEAVEAMVKDGTFFKRV